MCEINAAAYICKRCGGTKFYSGVELCANCAFQRYPVMSYSQYVDEQTKGNNMNTIGETSERLASLKKKLFLAIAEYEYEESRRSDKTSELTDTIAKLAVKKADLEDKICELSDTLAKLTVQVDVAKYPAGGEKQVIHG